MALYVTSWTEGAGKTSLCAGIGKWLQERGKVVGYLKPVALTDTGAVEDAGFIKQTLGLEEPVESLTPLCLTQQDLKTELNNGSLGGKVKQAYDEIAAGKDVVLLEGLAGLSQDAELAQSAFQISEGLDARVIMAVTYSRDLPWDEIASQAGEFGQRLLGIVINRVPQNKMGSVLGEAGSLFGEEGIKILGILPENRSLAGVSVAEIADRLQAKTLCCTEGMADLVENLMIGAMTPDSGVDYFSRKENKAVIARGERPDMQLAALATSTKCLILTGGVEPVGQVLSWAEDKGAPILLTEQDTLSTVSNVEETFVQARFRQLAKLDKLDEILQQRFNFSSLAEGLGLVS